MTEKLSTRLSTREGQPKTDKLREMGPGRYRAGAHIVWGGACFGELPGGPFLKDG